MVYPIHTAEGKGPTVARKKNEDYVKPKNVDVGECKRFLTEKYYSEYVPSGSSCVLVRHGAVRPGSVEGRAVAWVEADEHT